MQINALVREFHFNGLVLPDLNAQESPDGIRSRYAGTYPELATAAVEGPEFKDSRMIYTFKRSAGVKG